MSQQLPEQAPPAPPPDPWQVLSDPEAVVERLRRALDQTFAGLSRWPRVRSTGDLWSPPVDIQETDDAYVLEADLPGVEPTDLSIELVGSELMISGEVKKKETAGIVRRSARRVGRFDYRVALPAQVEADKVEASLSGGVLTVHVPKTERATRRKIELKTS